VSDAETKIIAAGRKLDSVLTDPRLAKDDPICVAVHDAMNLLTAAVMRLPQNAD
jgi:hypothetical protein